MTTCSVSQKGVSGLASEPLRDLARVDRVGAGGVEVATDIEVGRSVRAVVVRPGPTRSEFGFAWGPQVLERVLDSWKRWGFLRHNEMLDGEAIAAAVVWAATQPRSTSIDVIQVNPEG